MAKDYAKSSSKKPKASPVKKSSALPVFFWGVFFGILCSAVTVAYFRDHWTLVHAADVRAESPPVANDAPKNAGASKTVKAAKSDSQKDNNSAAVIAMDSAKKVTVKDEPAESESTAKATSKTDSAKKPDAKKVDANVKYKPLDEDTNAAPAFSVQDLLDGEEKARTDRSSAKIAANTSTEKAAPPKPVNLACATFSTRDKADAMKAQIAFQGLQSDVKAADSKGNTVYRVILGPYNSKRDAEKDKHKLENTGINTCRIM